MIACRPVHPLRELRDALSLTPTELADAVGRSRPFVVMVENGKTSLGRESVLALFDRYRDALNRLGITAEDLLRGSRERSGGDDGGPHHAPVA